jgi:2-oxoglutarate ferredoxin oxidoreductase subunit alpha
MRNNTINVLIGGEAGQGLNTIGQLLAKSLVRSGYSILVNQTYHSRVRGGHNTYSVRFGAKEVVAPEESVDILVALNDETVEIHHKEMVPKGIIIADQDVKVSGDSLVKVPFKTLGEPKVVNVLAMGVLGKILCLDMELVSGIIEETFGKKGSGVAEENRQALEKAYEWAARIPSDFCKLPALKNPGKKLMMTGHDAIALGAMSAGLKFYCFYPMTPSTSIGQTLAANAGRMGMVVEQAEDEISVINMALGASFAGAPAMVGTAGGGFALMVEAISLAGMTETPIVVVVGQRPAPATGLPTRTEQADLEFVLHAGHGEFPRAVFAPGTVLECFELTRKALNLADKYQSPVFILSDQFLADSYRGVEPFKLDNLPLVQPWKNGKPISMPYKRYQFTDTGVSPRLLPGMSHATGVVMADSDEHYEDSHITEDLSIRQKMVEKRLKKYDGIRSEIIAPEFSGDNQTDLLLVCWGSSKGAVMEAASDLRSKDHRRVGVLHFSQVWPLAPQQFLHRLQGAKKAVCVEGNAFGQFARLIRRETGFEFREQIHRYDGLTITPEYILRELKRLEASNVQT